MDRRILDLLAGFPGRGACTDAERRAAAALHDELRARGAEAWVEARWTRPRDHAVLLLEALLAVGGSLLSVVIALPAAIAAGVAALSLVVEAAGWPGPVRLLFPRRATQHVLTVPSAHGVALIISAAYAVARRRPALLRRRHLPLTAVAVCAVVVAAGAAARAAGVEGTWLGALQLVPTLVLLAVAANALDAMASGWAEGTNDNATGVAVAVALHDELRRRPPERLAPALLLHGAGPHALRAHLRGERLKPRDAVLLEVAPSGAGTPVAATRHRQIAAAAHRAADALGMPRGRRIGRPPRTRLPSVVVGADRPADDTVDDATLDAVLDYALAVVDALDAEIRP